MGLFSSSKKVFVASSVYNFAGDEEERTNYMKATVVRNILTGDTSTSLASGIVQSHLKGPGISLRNFYRWAKDYYDVIGLPKASITSVARVNQNVLINHLPRPAGEEVVIQGAEIGRADFINWAEKYLIENNYAAYNTNWLADIDNNTNVITITYENGTKQQINPVGFDKNANYIFAIYNSFKPASVGAEEFVEQVDVNSEDDFPFDDEFTKDYDVVSNRDQPLVTKVTTKVSYSDNTSDPDVVTSTTDQYAYLHREGKYTQTFLYPTEETGSGAERPGAYFHRYLYRVPQVTVQSTSVTNTEELPDGRTKTITVITDKDVFNIHIYYKVMKQPFTEVSTRALRVFLYKIGSGTAELDAMIQPPASAGQFFPIIPIRMDNRFISDSYYPTVYPQAKKAIKKAFNSRKATFQELVKKLNTNESIGDIDYAFAVFGVSLNVKENACKHYLYAYFKNLMATQTYGKAADDAYQATYARWLYENQRYQDYLDGRLQPPPNVAPSRPNYFPNRMMNAINIASNDKVGINYSVTLSWAMVHEVTGTGLGKAGAKKGDFWFQIMPDEQPPIFLLNYSGDDSNNQINTKISVVRLYWQDSNNTYRYLLIKGLGHTNYVYDGKFVFIQGSDALRDPEESGFIIPLHYDTYRSMSLVDSTQMSTACCFLVLNSYEIKKIKWYQKGFFRIFFVFVFAIVAAVFTGGAGFGILGSNLALGTSLGFTGMTAAILGSIANAVVAMVISSVIQVFSQALGGKFGAILGAIIGFVVMSVATSFLSTGSFSFNWGDLLRADNLLKFTDSLSTGYAQMVQGNAMEIQQQIAGITESYRKQSQEIAKLYSQNVGYSPNALNPMWITNATTRYVYEGSSTFLSRTLMTGTDIAQMSQDMLTDYTRLNLTLPSIYG